MLAFLEDTPTWTKIVQIVLLDLLLAGDNAVVIALAVRLLPKREQMLGRLWGTAGAVALRIVFLAVARWLLGIPWLQFVAGLLLLWIAYKLLTPDSHGAGSVEAGEENVEEVAAGDSLRAAIRIIVVADASMSLDNVLAVSGAAHGELWLAITGIAFSIPLVIWGSQILGAIMERHRWVVWIGGGVLGHVAGVLMLAEPAAAEWIGTVANPNWHWFTLSLGFGFALYGLFADRRVRRLAAAKADTNATTNSNGDAPKPPPAS